MRTSEQLGRGTSVVPTERPLGGAPSAGWPRRAVALVVAAAVIGALVGAGAMWTWERSGIRDRDSTVAQLIDERDAAMGQVSALTARVGRLEDRLATAGAQTEGLEQEVAEARAQLEVMLGPALPDGEHLGYLAAVGATQEPPRLVVDVVQWFTDQEAIEAAEADGMVAENGYYIRNADPRWRVLEIDPAAPVTLTTYPYADPSAPRDVSLIRFAELLVSGDAVMSMLPYWITVQDGTVVAIGQQFIP